MPGRLSGSSTLLFYIPRHVVFSDCVGISGIVEVERVGGSWGQEICRKCWVEEWTSRRGTALFSVCVDPDRTLFGAPPRSWDPHAIGEHVVPGRHLWFLYTLVLYSTAQRVLLLWGDYSIA